jgi:hypothetical protein
MMMTRRKYNTMNAGFKLKAGLIILEEREEDDSDSLLVQGLSAKSTTKLGRNKRRARRKRVMTMVIAQ